MLTNELKELARTIKEAVFDIETDNLSYTTIRMSGASVYKMSSQNKS